MYPKCLQVSSKTCYHKSWLQSPHSDLERSDSQPQSATTGFVIDLAMVVNTSRSGHRVLVPGVKEAIASLQERKIPLAFLIRETRLTEKKVARGLEKQLGLSIDSGSIVLPQTPFRDQVDEYKDKVIVVIGGDGDKARQAALKYGFNRVMTTKDIAELYPHIYGESSVARSKLDAPFDAKDVEQYLVEVPEKPWKSTRGEDIKVSAIFVWWASDQDNWDLDIGICIDLLLTKQGYIGTHTTQKLDYLKHWPHQQPQLFICKADTAPAGDGNPYPVPLRDSKTWLSTLEDWWAAKTGLPLDYVQYKYIGAGCNDEIIIDCADRMLRERNKKLRRDCHPFLRTVYMIGKDIQFGAQSDAYSVAYDKRVRRRSVRIDPSRSGQLREAAVHDFGPELRPWHVAGSLKEAVEYALYALAEEYWVCVEVGLKPLWPKPNGAITLA
ncbi:hypothetical protein C8A03DRAFT_18078 [Achaetomium macrosporum]|uniref:Uncharacterized protein n=1 Tax=Achaetomium macrosporum TaxID=79813 RepID=A0AAN7C506_9PEZI|nr:hypothetical protein C8A03DRAFT_18078 [Achaetomium macrosporum]